MRFKLFSRYLDARSLYIASTAVSSTNIVMEILYLYGDTISPMLINLQCNKYGDEPRIFACGTPD